MRGGERGAPLTLRTRPPVNIGNVTMEISQRSIA
jgi:hypothetical protein